MKVSMIKKHITALIVLAIGGIIFSSCKKVLDIQNQGQVSDDVIWSDPASINVLVNYIYTISEPDHFAKGFSGTGLPGAFRYAQGVIADEARPSITYIGRTNGLNNGLSFNLDRCPFWEWNYGAIRQCNDFLEKIDLNYVLPGDAPQPAIDQRNTMIGQVRFFRGYQYWRMVQLYGGVPIVDKVLNAGDSALYAPRNTQEECYQFIINDLKTAASLLPNKYTGQDVGRITKGTALALLSRVQLFRASPMYNDANPQFWKDASDAALSVINLGVYSLYDRFGQWFFDKTNPENIWQINFEQSRREHGWDAANFPNSVAIGDAVGACPTQELVEAFPMNNGKAITDPSSGYDPADPYINRDPRLKATVLCNGDTLAGVQPIWSYVSSGSNTPTNYLYTIDGFEQPYSTSTGYFMNKAIDGRLVRASPRIYNYNKGSYSDWIEIRYAEVLMNYAEAENELGNIENAYTQLKAIRKRAGIQPGGDGNYGIPAGLTQEGMRAVIQNERFIEFAFENKRYWDLRRWKLAGTVLNRPTHSMKITKLANTPRSPRGSDYNFQIVVNGNDVTYPPSYQDKFYFLPLPQDQLLLNPRLQQNPLWK
jgi:hypothetical protein